MTAGGRSGVAGSGVVPWWGGWWGGGGVRAALGIALWAWVADVLTAGKGGVARHVMGLVDPQGVRMNPGIGMRFARCPPRIRRGADEPRLVRCRVPWWGR